MILSLPICSFRYENAECLTLLKTCARTALLRSAQLQPTQTQRDPTYDEAHAIGISRVMQLEQQPKRSFTQIQQHLAACIRLQAGCGNVENVVHVVVHGSFVDHDSAPLKVGQRDADESRTAADEARCK